MAKALLANCGLVNGIGLSQKRFALPDRGNFSILEGRREFQPPIYDL
jgi:hypothetical protein